MMYAIVKEYWTGTTLTQSVTKERAKSMAVAMAARYALTRAKDVGGVLKPSGDAFIVLVEQVADGRLLVDCTYRVVEVVA